MEVCFSWNLHFECLFKSINVYVYICILMSTYYPITRLTYHLTLPLWLDRLFTAFCHYQQCCDECRCTHLCPHLVIICSGQIIGDKLLVWKEWKLLEHVSKTGELWDHGLLTVFSYRSLFWVWRVLSMFVTSCQRSTFPSLSQIAHVWFLCHFSSRWGYYPLSLLSSAQLSCTCGSCNKSTHSDNLVNSQYAWSIYSVQSPGKYRGEQAKSLSSWGL